MRNLSFLYGGKKGRRYSLDEKDGYSEGEERIPLHFLPLLHERRKMNRSLSSRGKRKKRILLEEKRKGISRG